MQLDDYFVALAPNDIRLKGHRIGIETILYEYVHRGLTPDAIAESFDTLTVEEVYATILYYHRHRQQLDAYLDTWLKQQDEARRTQDSDPAIRASQQRLAQIRAQLAETENAVVAQSAGS
jgi:uncharacterized protein (DUF433 family)